MSNFSRTLSTNDAYRIKIQNVEKDMDTQIAVMFEEMKMIDEKVKKLEAKNIAPGCFTSLIRFVFGLLTIIVVITFLMLWGEGSLSEPGIIYFYLPAAIIVGIYVSLIVRHRNILAKARDRDEETESLRVQKEKLYKKVNQYEQTKQRKIDEIKQEYAIHMEKQIEILDNEVLNQHPLEVVDTKECPRCAEVIKQKAKVCRFCKYEMD